MRKINKILKIIIIVLDFIGFILIINKKLDCTLLKWLLLTFPVIIPNILIKFKISINNTIEMMYLILIFLSFTLGRVFNLYDRIGWYDTFVHSVSGILIFIFGLIVLKYFKKYDKKIIFNILFSILMTIALASIWEFIEFGIDKVLHNDMQDVIKTGVDDTMKDMLVAFLLSIMTSIKYIYETKKNNKGIITILISG